MGNQHLSSLFLVCTFLCNDGMTAAADDSRQCPALQSKTLGKMLGECAPEMADRSAIAAALYSEGYRDSHRSDDLCGRLARRRTNWLARDLEFRLIENRAGPGVHSQVEFRFTMASTELDTVTTAAKVGLRAILTIRDCATGNTRADVSRPVALQYPGMSSRTIFALGEVLPAMPGEFVVVGTVAVVEEGCAPVVLAERAEKVLVPPTMSADELRAALVEANRLNGKGSELARETIRQCLSRVQIDASVLRILAEIGAVRDLDLSMRSLTDEDLQQLIALVELKELSLKGTRVNGQTVSALVANRELELLDISQSYLTPGTLSILARHPSLTGLKLSCCSLESQDSQVLAAMVRLTELDLSDTNVEDADLEKLAALANLKTMRLVNTRVSSAGVKHLEALRSLEVLDLRGTRVDDSDLALLMKFPALRELGVAGTRVTASGLRNGLQGTRIARLILDSRQRENLNMTGLNCFVLSSD